MTNPALTWLGSELVYFRLFHPFIHLRAMGPLEEALAASSTVKKLVQTADELALELLATMHSVLIHNLSRRDVMRFFNALHGMLRRSLARAATVWNDQHDRLRVLPPELQEICFAPLSITEKCQLALVSSHWRRMTACMPSLWTKVDVRRKPARLESLLVRSARLPVDLSLAHPLHANLSSIDRVVRCNADRIRGLTLVFETAKTKHRLLSRYAAPQLEELSLAQKRLAGHLPLPDALFRNHAPRLRTVRLSGVKLPACCPAFSEVVSVTLDRCSGSLRCLFDATPKLKRLTIVCSYGHLDLPQVSPNASSPPALEFEMTYEGLTIDRFDRFDSSALDELTVMEEHSGQLLTYAAQHFVSPDSVLQLRADGSLALVLPGSKTFIAHPAGFRMIIRDIFKGLTAFDAVQRLVLPASFPASVTWPQPPLLDEGMPLFLPGLRTLAIHYRGEPAETCWILEPGVLGGVISCPALARIEIVFSPDVRDAEPAAPINIRHLVYFLGRVLEVDDYRALEIFVDSARGLRLKGDTRSLERQIGKLIV
ncbi:hypothetical protein AURDEDRAFT_122386 [Auricularia subglabra TFB-10046 SS5]|nr:hypothetical protein AURDEDRAFT_122386 [Auricularia subglabra TFB-10046 SS5]